MDMLKTFTKRITLVAFLASMTFTAGGCFSGELLSGFWVQAANYSQFWQTTIPIPVSAYFSQKVEDAYWDITNFLPCALY